VKDSDFIGRTVDRIARTLAILSTVNFGFIALAHEGPEHDIEELTERISKEGESAGLLLERAIEYQVIRKHAEATKDLERALRLEPHSPVIQRELGRVYFSTGKTNEALQTVTRGLEAPVKGADRASLLVVRAEILRPRKEYQKALDDANDAIEEHPDNVEWYLLRSQLQAELKLGKERVTGLEEGIQQTGSGVLQIEWIDALIDNEQHSLALEKIEAELNSSRLQSSWLIRRAKVRLASDKADEAKADLQAAIKELTGRMSAAAPDPSLLADRGLAYELFDDKEKALKDYNLAKEKGITDEWLQERIRAVRGSEGSGEGRRRSGSRRRPQ
jgi:tetratricopeptide (TPR) repeat protein